MARFKKGESGNLQGRPKGIKDRRTEFRELLEPYAPALVNKAVAMALKGDSTALRLCLDRLIPPVKAVDVHEGGSTSDNARVLIYLPDNGRDR